MTTDLSALPLPCGCALCARALASGADGPGGAPFSAAGPFPVAAPASYVLALLPSTVPRWGGGAVGTGATVSYSFMESAPSYASSSDKTGFAALSATQRAAVREAFAAWSAVANINFVETSDTANSGSGGSIRIGSNRQSGVSAAYAYYPTGSLYDTGGDIYLANDSANNTTPTAGTYGFKTILHEIGHAIGLKHPGNYNAGGGGSEGPYLSSAEDNYRYSLMSYNDHPSLGLKGLPKGPALYDIAAIQYLYGANTQTRLGNDTYSYSGTAAFSDSIWDAAGSDTIDASAQSKAVTIDLSEGAFSSIGSNGGSGTAVGNVSIAYGVTIENATGGAGNDILLGNAVANILTGGAGNDTLTGGDGHDTLDGGAGTDTAVYSGNRSGYTVTLADGTVTITRNSGDEGTDTLTGIEYAAFADQVISLRPATVTARGSSVLIGRSGVQLSTLISATDPAGGTVTQYELVDRTTGGGTLLLGGTTQTAGVPVSVTAAALSTLSFVAGTSPGSDELAVRAYNGLLWSGWTSFSLVSRFPNLPPAVQADRTLILQEGAATTPLGLGAPRDPDGDAMAVAVVSVPSSGTVRLANGVAVTRSSVLSPADLAGLTYTPASGFSGDAGSFAYTVTDTQGESSRQTVTFKLTPLSQITADFNPFVYLASNLDLADRFGLDGNAARTHYLQSGRFEGRPAASFDPMAYLVQNPDLIRALGYDATAAARHYLQFGRRERRTLTGFDPLAYLAANPDLAAAFGTDTAKAALHYVNFGRGEGRSTAFDALAYLGSNPDLSTAFGVDTAAALRHYITSGRREGRTLGRFDPLAYLAANPDLAAGFQGDTTRATEHYILHGRNEGRGTSFDALSYLAANPDLAAAFGEDRTKAMQHYVSFGRGESRGTSFNVRDYLWANPELQTTFGGNETLALTYRIRYEGKPRRDAGFDPLSYLAANPDLAAGFGFDPAAATAHYQASGRAEGRPTTFNAFAYLAANPDLRAAFGDDDAKALEHFIRYGRLERRLNPLGYTPPSSSPAAAGDGTGGGLLAAAAGLP